jgi:hypothetical protein
VFSAAVMVLGGLAFFMDAYRLPVITVLILWLVLVGRAPNSDHFYRIWPITQAGEDGPPGKSDVLTPALVLERAGQAGKPIVLVAIAGGGIQSAAWSAQVLTGLEKAAQEAHNTEEFHALPEFASSVQCLSGVSGGSVGAMFFAASYGPGGLPPPRVNAPVNEDISTDFLDRIVASAEDTSLGQAVWGLAYPDFRRAWFPFSAGNVYRDRAEKMEEKWATNGAKAMTITGAKSPAFDMKLRSATLAGWQKDVQDGIRPAIIFNGTIVETGERIAFSTAPTDRFYEGQREFVTVAEPNELDRSLYPGADVRITTAARLSATFPLVSPAGRPCVSRNNEPEEDGIYQPQGHHAKLIPSKNGLYHVVDGGYYDNTGLSAITQWLDDGLSVLSKKGSQYWPRSILIIALDGFPGDYPTKPAEKPADRSEVRKPDLSPVLQSECARGAIFQLCSPISVLCNVRGAAHNAFAQRTFDTFQYRWKLALPNERDPRATCDIQLVKFTMPLLDPNNQQQPWWKPTWSEAQPKEPPLSWHLRDVEKRHIAEAWMALRGESRYLPKLASTSEIEPSRALEESNPSDPRIRPVDSVIKFLHEASKQEATRIESQKIRTAAGVARQ